MGRPPGETELKTDLCVFYWGDEDMSNDILRGPSGIDLHLDIQMQARRTICRMPGHISEAESGGGILNC